jgi:phage gp29-like protein
MQIGALDYKIEGTPELQDFVATMFQELDFDSLLHDLTSAIGFGFANIELSWESREDFWIPTAYQFLKQGIVHKETLSNRLYFFTDDGKRVYLDSNPDKFFTYIHKSNSGFLEDFGLFNSLAWAFVITDFIYSNYLNYTDIVGIPPLIAIGDDEKPEDILEQLLLLRDGNTGILPKNFEVKLLEAKGTGDHFLKAIEYIDKKKSNILLGGNLNSDSGTHGSQSLGEVQEKNKDEILRFDIAILQRFINRFLKTSLKFSKFANSPFKFRFLLEKETQKNSSFPTLYNFQEEELDQIGKFEKEMDLGKIQKEISETVLELIKNSSSKEELLEEMYSRFGEIEFSKLEKTLENALAGSVAEGLTNW